MLGLNKNWEWNRIREKRLGSNPNYYIQRFQILKNKETWNKIISKQEIIN